MVVELVEMMEGEVVEMMEVTKAEAMVEAAKGLCLRCC